MAWSDSCYGAAIGYDELSALLDDDLAREALPADDLAVGIDGPSLVDEEGEELFRRIPERERERREHEWRDLAFDSLPEPAGSHQLPLPEPAADASDSEPSAEEDSSSVVMAAGDGDDGEGTSPVVSRAAAVVAAVGGGGGMSGAAATGGPAPAAVAATPPAAPVGAAGASGAAPQGPP